MVNYLYPSMDNGCSSVSGSIKSPEVILDHYLKEFEVIREV